MRNIWLVGFILILAGCGREVEHEPLEVLGERKNPQGGVVQVLIRERTITGKSVALVPDGSAKTTSYKDKYILQAKDGTRQTVPVKSADELRNCGKFWPVAGSPLWVGVGVDPVSNQNTGHVATIEGKRVVSHNENDLHIVVFDAKGVTVHRTFSVQPKLETAADEFGIVNSNRTIRFRSPEGPKNYEVLENKVLSAEAK